MSKTPINNPDRYDEFLLKRRTINSFATIIDALMLEREEEMYVMWGNIRTYLAIEYHQILYPYNPNK